MEKVEEKVEKAVENLNENLSANDWWGRHNMTSRIITLTSTFLLVIVVIADVFGLNMTHYDKTLEYLSDMVLYITIAIILGVNGAPQVLKAFNKLRGGK